MDCSTPKRTDLNLTVLIDFVTSFTDNRLTMFKIVLSSHAGRPTKCLLELNLFSIHKWISCKYAFWLEHAVYRT